MWALIHGLWLSLLWLPSAFAGVPLISNADTISIETKNPLAHATSFLTFLDSFPHQMTLEELAFFLRQTRPTLRPEVFQSVIQSLSCAEHFDIDHNSILAVIDYSLPSNEKRLWIYDLKAKKLLFHTYVSHGIGSGELLTTLVSNRNNSKASSVGVYKTDVAYYGREGVSLRLKGIEPAFNDNASNRAIVMHGGWYVEEDFIKRYGRAGRSWGCPALPEHLSPQIIQTIKNEGWLVAYSPHQPWIKKSRFLNCRPAILKIPHASTLPTIPKINLKHPQYENVLFIQTKSLKPGEDHSPFAAIDANRYTIRFHKNPPLRRMLRRQIDHHEYIALSEEELNVLMSATDKNYRDIQFVQAYIVNQRGYWATKMKVIDFGGIDKIETIAAKPQKHGLTQPQYLIKLKTQKTLILSPTHAFVRFIGL